MSFESLERKGFKLVCIHTLKGGTLEKVKEGTYRCKACGKLLKIGHMYMGGAR